MTAVRPALRPPERGTEAILARLRSPELAAADREAWLAELVSHFEHEDPEVWRGALGAVAEAPSFVDYGGCDLLIARLASMGADGESAKANDALRALKAVEVRLEGARAPHIPSAAPRDPLK